MSEEAIKNYVRYVIAHIKRKIKEGQNAKNYSLGPEDDAYKMGYLLALYDIIDALQLRTGDFGVEKKHLGLNIKFEELLTNFLVNLSYVSEKNYQKRLRFDENDYAEFDQLNDHLLDQCEYIFTFHRFEKEEKKLLLEFYGNLEPFYQDYQSLSKGQRRREWKKIIELAKALLKAFNFQKTPKMKIEVEIELSKNEYEYLSRAFFIPEDFKKWIAYSKQNQDNYLLQIPSVFSDEIRTLCGEQLQLTGFNEKYEPTPEGKILESLIDKFFTG